MKSLKDFAMNLPEEDYHSFPAYSYSLIARYAREGFGAIRTLHDPVVQTDSMRFGSLFDALLTHNGNARNEYVVFEKDIPPARKAVLDRIAQLSNANSFYKVDEHVIKAALVDCDYKAAKKYETQYEHLAEFADYYEVVKSGKKMVSQKDWLDALDMANAVYRNEYLKQHFGVSSTDKKEFLYQIQFVVPYDSITHTSVKCMFDMLEVDHQEKTIQPWDIKTSADPAFGFDKSFVKFRYDIQADLYTDILRAICAQSGYQDYKILPFKFMDISRTDKQPVTWEYDTTDYSQINGLSFGSNGKTYQFKSYRQLLDEIIEYEEAKAVVPNHITVSAPNNIIEILNKDNG